MKKTTFYSLLVIALLGCAAQPQPAAAQEVPPTVCQIDLSNYGGTLPVATQAAADPTNVIATDVDAGTYTNLTLAPAFYPQGGRGLRATVMLNAADTATVTIAYHGLFGDLGVFTRTFSGPVILDVGPGAASAAATPAGGIETVGVNMPGLSYLTITPMAGSGVLQIRGTIGNP